MSKHLSFKIINPRRPGYALPFCMDELVNSWVSLWEDVFQELHIDACNFYEEFFKCDKVGVLLLDGQFAGSVHFRIFELKMQSIEQLDYFKRYKPVYEKLCENQLKIVTTGEYFCIDPLTRGSNVSMHLAPILVGLAARYAFHCKTDALIGPTRKTHGMDRITQKFGASILIESSTGHHHTPTDFVAVTQKHFRPYPFQKVESHIAKIWSEYLNSPDSASLVINEEYRSAA